MPTAVFTLAHNARPFLDRWLGYYSRYFGYTDLFVLDLQSIDGSTNYLPCHRMILKYTPNQRGEIWKSVSDFQKMLLHRYDTVIFTQPHEILWHPAGLPELLASHRGSAMKATGYEIALTDDDAPLQYERPVLAQRKFWNREESLDKTLITRMTLHWSLDFAGTDLDLQPEPGLLLISLQEKKKEQLCPIPADVLKSCPV